MAKRRYGAAGAAFLVLAGCTPRSLPQSQTLGLPRKVQERIGKTLYLSMLLWDLSQAVPNYGSLCNAAMDPAQERLKAPPREVLSGGADAVEHGRGPALKLVAGSASGSFLVMLEGAAGESRKVLAQVESLESSKGVRVRVDYRNGGWARVFVVSAEALAFLMSVWKKNDNELLKLLGHSSSRDLLNVEVQEAGKVTSGRLKMGIETNPADPRAGEVWAKSVFSPAGEAAAPPPLFLRARHVLDALNRAQRCLEPGGSVIRCQLGQAETYVIPELSAFRAPSLEPGVRDSFPTFSGQPAEHTYRTQVFVSLAPVFALVSGLVEQGVWKTMDHCPL